MKLNKTLYYIHNTLFALYSIFIVLLILMIFTLGGKQTDWLAIVVIFLIVCGLAYFHYKAAIEVEMGTETGKLMSTFIGCLFLIGFPIGTCIGLLILLNLRKSKWQYGQQLETDLTTNE
ncbi:hypothetical protein [Acinetobacter sp. Marseille-Q1618]|uniref:hypothetical protein n=1 Tax=Acinetobacter sp. Marseille-Q1618 TaxID=2697502 RepID=UPI0015709A7F|nr:hypothetical protein [Acinetobacter sp. Marseille-Q1618]